MLIDKIDVRPIIRGHFETLSDNAFTRKASREDLILFFALPTVAAAGVCFFGFRFRVDAVNGILNVFAILTGLLLNLLVLVLTLTASKAPEGVDTKKRLRLVKEIFVNISFSVLVAVAVVCVALVSLSYMRSNQGATTGVATTFALVAFTANFILSLTMVLKRIYALIEKDLRSDSESRAA